MAKRDYYDVLGLNRDASEDDIKFEVLVETMDTALSARFADISLLDAGGAGI